MSNQIQNRIKRIVEKRKEEVKKLSYRIKKHTLGQEEIISIIKKEKQLTKKELKYYKKMDTYSSYDSNQCICFYEYRMMFRQYGHYHDLNFNGKRYDSRQPEYYPKELYDLLIKCANIHLQHQEKYLVKEKKKELYELTKCLKSLEGINPCEKKCETCDITYPLDAQFCSKCGKQLQ